MESNNTESSSRFRDIFEATEKGTLEDVKYFVEEQGVDVNITNDKGSIPLHFAVDNPDITDLNNKFDPKTVKIGKL